MWARNCSCPTSAQALRAGRESQAGTALANLQQQCGSLVLETVRALFIHVCQQSLPPILITYMSRCLVHRARDTTATSRYVAYISVFTVQLLLKCRSVAWHRKVTCIVASHYKSGFSNLSRVWISLATGLLLQLSVPAQTGQTTCTELHWLCSARFHAGTNRPNNLHWAPLTLLCPFPCRCEQGKYLHWAGQCLARANRPNNLQCPACQLPWRSRFVLRSAGRLKPQI